MSSCEPDMRDQADEYEAPKLTDFGTVEEWTQGPRADIITISLVI